MARLYRPALTLLVVTALGTPPLTYAVQGWFSRYAADDYCTAAQVQAAGFLGAQGRIYTSWSGRFAATFLVTLSELAGPTVVSVLPALALAAWLTAATWAIRELANAFRHPLALPSAVALAVLLVYVTLKTTADMPQILYWQTGTLTYLSSLVLATLYVGWVARALGTDRRQLTRPAVLVLSLALTLVAGGTSETFAVGQVTALALACGIASLAPIRPAHPSLVMVLLAGLLGAITALLIVGAAPGNEQRQTSPARMPLDLAVLEAVEFTGGWLRLTFARPHAIELILLVGLTAALAIISRHAGSSGWTWSALPRLVMLLVGVASIGLVVLACMLPAFYALGSNPPGRAQLVPQWVLMCGLAMLAWLTGRSAPWRVAGAFTDGRLVPFLLVGLVALIALGPLSTAMHVTQQLATDRAYAAAWDQLDSDVRAQRAKGIDAVTVPRLVPSGNIQNLAFVGANRADWFNQCVAQFYGVGSIATEQ